MLLLILEANEALAVVAFVSSGATLLFVVREDFDLEHLATVSAFLRSHLTVVFVITEGRLEGCESTVLARNLDVCLRFVLLPVSLGHHFAAFFALVVGPCTANLVHAELTDFDVSLTSWTLSCFLNFNHVSSV